MTKKEYAARIATSLRELAGQIEAGEDISLFCQTATQQGPLQGYYYTTSNLGFTCILAATQAFLHTAWEKYAEAALRTIDAVYANVDEDEEPEPDKGSGGMPPSWIN